MQRTSDIDLTGTQTANFLGVSPQTLAELCRTRKIAFVGRPRRFRLGDVVEYRETKNATDAQIEERLLVL